MVAISFIADWYYGGNLSYRWLAYDGFVIPLSSIIPLKDKIKNQKNRKNRKNRKNQS